MPTYLYHCDNCGKTYIGLQVPSMTCNCEPPKPMIGKMYSETAPPLSKDLEQVLSIGEAIKLRAELCTAWRITNKSHNNHGSNFSSPQKLVNLIHNIVTPVTGKLLDTVREACIRTYGYDFVERKMAK